MIKRFLPLLLLLAASCSAWGQSIVGPFRTPSDCFDLARDTVDGSKMSYLASASTNTTAFQNAINKCGRYTGDPAGRIIKPLYLPPYLFTINAITIGADDAGTSARAGLQILTGGGTGVGVGYNASFSSMQNITRLVYVGSKGSNQAAITYNGAGLWLGPMELCGVLLASGTDYNNRNDTDLFPKTPTGIRVTSLNTSGVPNGRIQSAGLMLQGFSKGIEIYQSDTSGNNDNLYWHFLDFDACTVGYECNSAQSVTHQVDKVHTGFYVGTLFKFIKGGDLHVDSVQVNCPSCTILDLSGMTYDVNWGNFEIRNVRFDNIADNPVLLKLSAYDGTPRNVVITGSVGTGVTYTAADLVQGENAADKIYIRFTGTSQAVADFNSQSTVDEAPF